MATCTNCGHECHGNRINEFNDTMDKGWCSKGDGCDCNDCQHAGDCEDA